MVGHAAEPEDPWFAYVLRSQKDGGLYVGMAKDVEGRVKEHNRGYNSSTRSRVPLTLIYFEKCVSREKAREREKYLKSGKGREFLKSQAGVVGF
jgi:putative endonuclease